MAKGDTRELLQCLQPFDSHPIDMVMWLRDIAWDLLSIKDPMLLVQGKTLLKSPLQKSSPKKVRKNCSQNINWLPYLFESKFPV